MMKSTYLENEHIRLRAIEPEDLQCMYDIENDPSQWEVSSFTVPYSRYVLKQYIEQSTSDIFADKQLRLMITRKADNRTLGIIDITDFAPLHGRGAIGVVINEEFRRQGYAKESIQLLSEYAFGFLHLKQLYAFIAADNKASLDLFAACGFVRCGLLKEWVRSNHQYKDVVMMQRIAENLVQ